MQRRSGNVMVVALIILIVFPSILMIAHMSGSSFRVIVSNKKLHQELNNKESMKILLKDTAISYFEGKEIPIERDVIIIEGLKIFGDYYVPANTEIDLEGFIEGIETRGTLYTVFEYDSVGVLDLKYTKNLTPLVKRVLPFALPINIECTIRTEKDGVVYEYPLQLEMEVVLTASENGHNTALIEVRNIILRVLEE